MIFIFLLLLKFSFLTSYVTDVAVIGGGSPWISCPSGYTKYNLDLNAGAGGAYIYFCIKYEPVGGEKFIKPLTGMFIAYSWGALNTCGSDKWKFHPYDLNAGAGGMYMYLCTSNEDTIIGKPMKELFALTWMYWGYCNPADLNAGAGGEYIYACARYDDNPLPKRIDYHVSEYYFDQATVSNHELVVLKDSVVVDGLDAQKDFTTDIFVDSVSSVESFTWELSSEFENEVNQDSEIATPRTIIASSDWQGFGILPELNAFDLDTNEAYIWYGSEPFVQGDVETAREKRFFLRENVEKGFVTEFRVEYFKADVQIPYLAEGKVTYYGGKVESADSSLLGTLSATLVQEPDSAIATQVGKYTTLPPESSSSSSPSALLYDKCPETMDSLDHHVYGTKIRCSCFEWSEDHAYSDVYGTKIFTSDSSVCGAADFLGLDFDGGLQVTLIEGQPFYQGGAGGFPYYMNEWDLSFVVEEVEKIDTSKITEFVNLKIVTGSRAWSPTDWLVVYNGNTVFDFVMDEVLSMNGIYEDRYFPMSDFLMICETSGDSWSGYVSIERSNGDIQFSEEVCLSKLWETHPGSCPSFPMESRGRCVYIRRTIDDDEGREPFEMVTDGYQFVEGLFEPDLFSEYLFDKDDLYESTVHIYQGPHAWSGTPNLRLFPDLKLGEFIDIPGTGNQWINGVQIYKTLQICNTGGDAWSGAVTVSVKQGNMENRHFVSGIHSQPDNHEVCLSKDWTLYGQCNGEGYVFTQSGTCVTFDVDRALSQGEERYRLVADGTRYGAEMKEFHGNAEVLLKPHVIGSRMEHNTDVGTVLYVDSDRMGAPVEIDASGVTGNFIEFNEYFKVCTKSNDAWTGTLSVTIDGAKWPPLSLEAKGICLSREWQRWGECVPFTAKENSGECVEFSLQHLNNEFQYGNESFFMTDGSLEHNQVEGSGVSIKIETFEPDLPDGELGDLSEKALELFDEFVDDAVGVYNNVNKFFGGGGRELRNDQFSAEWWLAEKLYIYTDVGHVYEVPFVSHDTETGERKYSPKWEGSDLYVMNSMRICNENRNRRDAGFMWGGQIEVQVPDGSRTLFRSGSICLSTEWDDYYYSSGVCRGKIWGIDEKYLYKVRCADAGECVYFNRFEREIDGVTMFTDGGKRILFEGESVNEDVCPDTFVADFWSKVNGVWTYVVETADDSS